MSAGEKALRVCVRTLPRAPTLNASAEQGISADLEDILGEIGRDGR